MKTKTQRTAAETYNERMNEARELLAKVTALVETNLGFNTSKLDWTHAGSAGYLVEQLNQIVDAHTNND